LTQGSAERASRSGSEGRLGKWRQHRAASGAARAAVRRTSPAWPRLRGGRSSGRASPQGRGDRRWAVGSTATATGCWRR